MHTIERWAKNKTVARSYGRKLMNTGKYQGYKIRDVVVVKGHKTDSNQLYWIRLIKK